MLFPVELGVENPQKAYLRGETAQGAYVNFSRMFEQLRRKLPLGMAIVGKAYRNEISPRNLLIRMREFTQAELQIFFDPATIDTHEKFNEISDYKIHCLSVGNKDTEEIKCSTLLKKLPKFYLYHMAIIQKFYLDVLKIPVKKFRFKELSDEEKAFYNKYHWDVELEIGNEWKEVGGCHYRTDHDLTGHQKVSKKKMEISIDGNKVIPHVLELSFGVDRNILALMDIFLDDDGERQLFRFPPIVSPYDCAVFPLVNKDGLPEKSQQIRKQLSKAFLVFYDKNASLGHVRLSIIDLKGGKQPMSNEAGNIWVVYNGEIYNFLSLKQDLIKNS